MPRANAPAEAQEAPLSRGVVVIPVVQDVGPESVDWLVEAFPQRALDPVVFPYDAPVAQAWPLRTEQPQAARVADLVTRTTG